jgi:hypothetical protein
VPAQHEGISDRAEQAPHSSLPALAVLQQHGMYIIGVRNTTSAEPHNRIAVSCVKRMNETLFLEFVHSYLTHRFWDVKFFLMATINIDQGTGAY